MNRTFSKMGGRIERGFTLIELLVTLGVIAIAIGIGIPMYGSFTQGSSVSGATSDLIAALNDSRSRAVAERKRVRLEALGGDWVAGWRSVRVEDDVVLFTVTRNAGDDVKIAETNSYTRLMFNREGRSVDDAGNPAPAEFEISLVNADSASPRRIISVNPLGRVELEKTTGPGTP